MFKLYYKAIIIVLGITIAGLFVTTLIMIPKVQENTFKLESQNAQLQLEKVIELINSKEQELKDYEKSALELHKIEVKSITQVALSILNTYYNEAQKSDSKSYQSQKKAEAITLINQLRYGNDNYVYLTDKNIILLSHPIKKFIGFDFKKVKGAKGKYFALEMSNKADKYGESYVKYWWPKSIGGIAKEKLSYTVKFKPWNIYVGTGVYIDELNTNILKKKEQIKSELSQYLSKIKIAQNGYLYMFNAKGKLLIHPNKDFLNADKVNQYKNPQTNTLIFDDLVKAAQEQKPYHYKWTHPKDLKNYKYKKISWITYNEYFDWYIVSSAYLDDIHATSQKLTNKQYMTALFTLIISLILGALLFRKLLQPISDLSESSLKVQQGDFTIRSSINQDDEIGQLAKNFNEMLDTIEDHVKNLDKKVNDKTIEIEEVNDTLAHLVEVQVEKLSNQNRLIHKQAQYAALGEMMDAIAHQWKQPISIISLKVTQLALKKDLKRQISDEDIENMTNEVMEQIYHLNDTIDDFRQFFRPNVTLEHIDILSHIESTLTLMENTIQKNFIDIVIDSKEQINVDCIPNELKHIFINLINNSKDAFIENDIKNRKIEINFYRNTQNVIIEFRDNAGGIPQDIIDKIFTVNFTTKTASDGTGVGLYMSKQIVEKIQGTIAVDNIKDGVCFTINIPRKMDNQ
jgi:signal transduction histidine kinase